MSTSGENLAPTLRVATYNVHACVGMDRQRSETRIAEVIASMSVDVVGLQELDSKRARSAHVDQAEVIASALGWRHVFHPAMRHGDELYGNAIVSRLPFEVIRTVELPGLAPWYCREQRAAIWIELETALGPVHLINCHLGLGRAERMLQAALLIGRDWLGSLKDDKPTVLLGDFNSMGTSASYRFLARAMRDVRTLVHPRRRHRTFPTRFPSIAVDHIFVNDALRPTHLEVHRTPLARIASDHYPLVAELAAARSGALQAAALGE